MIITKDNPFYWKDPREEAKRKNRIEPKTLVEKYNRIKLRSSINLTKREDIVKKTYKAKDWMVLFQYLEQEIKPMIRDNFQGEDAEVVKQLFQRLYNFGHITI